MTARPVVAVIGGTGFLGRAIVSRLSRAGAVVRVVARHPQAVTAPVAAGAVEPCRADIRDQQAIGAALEGAQAVVNAVALYVERDSLRFSDVHVDGAGRVARLAAQAGATALAHISGIGADAVSTSTYVRARAGGEQAVRTAFPAAVILRPSVLFGLDAAFVATLAALTRLPVIPLFGDGGTRLQPVHVDDVAAAVQRVLATPELAGTTFELGGARVYRYRELVQAALEAHGRRRPLLPVPFGLWKLLAAMASTLPNPPLTRDQVLLLQRDNVVGQDVHTFTDLGIEPRAMAFEHHGRTP